MDQSSQYQQFIKNPFQFTEQLFLALNVEGLTGLEGYSEVVERVGSLFPTNKPFSDVLPINTMLQENLKSGQVYTFTGMIQDNLNDEFFPVVCSVEQSKKFGYLKEALDMPDEYTQEDARNCFHSRRVFKCITVPGENVWTVDRDERMILQPPENLTISNGDNESDSNVPLSTMIGHAKELLIKVYDPAWHFPINSVVQFVGVVYFGNESKDNEDSTEKNITEDGEAEPFEIYDPPSWEVPRLHAVAHQVIPPCRELFWLTSTGPTTQFWSDYLTRAMEGRRALLNTLSHICFNDELAAKYILLNFFSRVYSWENDMAIGKLGLNIMCSNSEITPEKRELFTTQLYSVIKLLFRKSRFLDLSVENINQISYVPRKNGSDLCLKSAVLQLSSQTHLTINESLSLSQSLTPIGQKNKAALQSLAYNQRITYDIDYFDRSFELDAPLIVISNEISEIKPDAVLPLFPSCAKSDSTKLLMTSGKEAEDDFANLRTWFEASKVLDVSNPDEVQRMMQIDFVDSRHQFGGDNYTPEEFLLLLTMTRLLCLSYGEESFTMNRWNEVRDMERERKKRLVV